MPGYYDNIMYEFTEWLYKLYHLKINKISVFLVVLTYLSTNISATYVTEHARALLKILNLSLLNDYTNYII